MQISFELTEKEFVKASTRMPWLRAHVISVVGGSVIVAVLGLYLIVLGAYAFGIFSLVFAGLLPLYRRWLITKHAARTYRDAKFLHGETSADIDETGTRMSYASGSSITTWDGYKSWTETEGTFILFLSDQFIRLFPKRAMTDSQVLELRTLLGQKLSRR